MSLEDLAWLSMKEGRMGTVRIETCPDCGGKVGEGHLYEHQQKWCKNRVAKAMVTPTAYAAIELRSAAAWIRTPGNITRDDAIDECARVLENRAHQLCPPQPSMDALHQAAVEVHEKLRAASKDLDPESKAILYKRLGELYL